jgi:hypothetical protein
VWVAKFSKTFRGGCNVHNDSMGRAY